LPSRRRAIAGRIAFKRSTQRKSRYEAYRSRAELQVDGRLMIAGGWYMDGGDTRDPNGQTSLHCVTWVRTPP